MTLDDVVHSCGQARSVKAEPSWQELFNMSYDELKAISKEHQEILASGTIDDKTRISHIHAHDFLQSMAESRSDWIQVLNYIDQMLENGSINPLVVEEIHRTNGSAISFSRIKTDKKTAKAYNGEGLLIECARFYPSGTVVRTFHSVFNHPDFKECAEESWEKATRGQEFYYGLVDFIKKRFGSKNRLNQDEAYIVERISRASPVRPLHSEGLVLDNVFIDGCDMQEHIENTRLSIDERVKMLAEITDIDLISCFYSSEFKRTGDGKANYTKGWRKKQIFTPKDYRLEVFEKILLKADRQFFRELVDAGIISTAGVVHDAKAFSVFYNARDSPQSQVLDLIGIESDNLSHQGGFTPFDLNLGNVMVVEKDGQRNYTHIDFERSQEDSLESMLFSRWADAGIYDDAGNSCMLENGMTAEQQLLKNAYNTIAVLHRVEGRDVPSEKEFLKHYQMQKKKHLLRLARRYNSFEKADSNNGERLRAAKRFFYTLFAYELAKEGMIAGIDDKKLDYLNTLFEAPLSRQEMQDVSRQYNPGFRSSSELSPIDIKEVSWMNRELIRKYHDAKRWQGVKRWFVRGAILALGLGVGVAGYISSYEHGLREKQKAFLKANADLHARVCDAVRADSLGQNTGSQFAQQHIDEFERRFGDRKTARAAYVDFYAVYEAVRESGGKSDWKTVEKYLSDKNPDMWYHLMELGEHVDNFVFYDSTRNSKNHADGEEYNAKVRYDLWKRAGKPAHKSFDYMSIYKEVCKKSDSGESCTTHLK